jgi:hypothetical protein
VLQHWSRNISEQDAERRTNALNGAEGDQAIPGTYIGKNHIGSEPGSIENAIGIEFESGPNNPIEFGIAGVSVM